jgi:hypothetical protein
MTNQTTINSPVSVTAVAFGRNMRAYPRRIEFEGTTYSFVDTGLRTVIRTGGKIAQILTMSDGFRDFRLRSDDRGGNWTLLSIQG